MTGHRGHERRIWRGTTNSGYGGRDYPDLYSPSSDGYTERARETETELPGGLTLVNLGEPIARLAGSPQPVPVNKPAAPSVPVVSPPPAALPLPAPADPSKMPRARHWRDDFGIAKHT